MYQQLQRGLAASPVVAELRFDVRDKEHAAGEETRLEQAAKSAADGELLPVRLREQNISKHCGTWGR